MRLPLWLYRWLHRRQVTRPQLRHTWLHRRLGDALLDKALWRPTRRSIARAWLIGWPITMVPFLPAQSLIAATLAFLVRGNILLAVALQFVSIPVTGPIHLPACYFAGMLLLGHSPAEAWATASDAFAATWVSIQQGRWPDLSEFTNPANWGALYLGAIWLGLFIGFSGYLGALYFPSLRRHRAAPIVPPPAPTAP